MSPFTFPDKSREGNDFFPTDPRWVKPFLRVEPLPGDIWEPAAGDGAMVRALEDFGYDVDFASDFATEEDGYLGAGVRPGLNFLMSQKHATTIITNPPYKHLDEFVARGLRLSDSKLAYLILLPALASSRKRYSRVWSMHPPNRIWAVNGNMTVHGKPSIGQHAWVVWDRENPLPPRSSSQFNWLMPDKN